MDTLLQTFDSDKDGFINFDEFLAGLRGKMNPNRQAVCDQIFNLFNINEGKLVRAEDIRVRFNSKSHPKVISGDITDDEAFDEFLQNLDPDKTREDLISYIEWNDYYSNVSFIIDNDEHFEMLMAQVWKF